MTQFFNGLVNTEASFPEYKPSNGKIGVQALREKFALMHSLNIEVIANTQDLKENVVDRKAQFEELRVRAQRIKAYVKAQYGIKSEPHNMIKGMRF